MAQLNDLLVLGKTNFISEVKINDSLNIQGNLSVKGTIDQLSKYLLLSGGTMTGNIIISNTNPHVEFIDTANNQIYYIQGHQGKFSFGPTFDKAIQIDSNGNMTLPGSAIITPRVNNTGSLGTSSQLWNSAYITTVNSNGIEFIGYNTNGGYIDFHYGKSTADYTSRIIEDASGRLSIEAPNGIVATGVLKLKANMYEDARNGALDMSNSDIFNANSIYFADLADNGAEGIHFYRAETTVDSLWAKNGVLYFTPNRTMGSSGTNYTVIHNGNYKNYKLNELEYFLTENPSNNVTGYRLLYQATPGTWSNSRVTLGVSSRHNGNGIVCIAFGCNGDTVSAANVYGQIIYYGNNNNANNSTGTVFTEDMFLLYYNSSTNKISLFSKYYDYSTIKINILNSYSTGSGLSTITLSNFSNGAYVTSIDSSTYGSQICKTTRAWVQGDTITGAVWNDYAEYREADTIEPGYVLIEVGDDTLTKSIERLQPYAGVSSDTWGFSQGETEKAKTPIAVAGRVLVYPFQKRENYEPGQCVCAAPGGTVDIMTEEEIVRHPDRIVGTVSCVPTYDTWGGGSNADRPEVAVNNRIWIKVR